MELDKYQIRAWKRLRRNNGGAIWHKVGEGKTRVILRWFATIAKRSDIPCSEFFVVCRREAFADWVREVKKCKLDWFVEEFSVEKTCLPRLMRKSRPIIWLVSHGMLDKMQWDMIEMGAQAIAYDEGFLYKNPRSKHTIAAAEISENVPAAIASGSIMTQGNLEDIFGQMYAIGRNELLGRTLTNFRSRYMVRYNLYGESGPIKFANRRGAKKQIMLALRNISSVHFPKSNRKAIDDIHKIAPTKTQRGFIDLLRQEYRIALKGEELELRNAPSMITKVCQISDGFVKMKSGVVVLDENPKLDYLVGKVAELLACGERVVVWTAYRRSVRLILQRLQKELPKCADGFIPFYSGLPFDRERWARKGKVAIGTEASGSSVNYLEQVAHAIYYSMDYKWLHLQQSRGRTDRKASKHSTCYYEFLQLRHSLDRFVYRTAIRSQKAEKELIDLRQLGIWLSQ